MSIEILQNIVVCGVATVMFAIAKILIMRSVRKNFKIEN